MDKIIIKAAAKKYKAAYLRFNFGIKNTMSIPIEMINPIIAEKDWVNKAAKIIIVIKVLFSFFFWIPNIFSPQNPKS